MADKIAFRKGVAADLSTMRQYAKGLTDWSTAGGVEAVEFFGDLDRRSRQQVWGFTRRYRPHMKRGGKGLVSEVEAIKKDFDEEIDHIVPVDFYVPGCPPNPEGIIDAVVRIQQMLETGAPRAAWQIRAALVATSV